MADVNKTIEITMKANLKQLQQSLENIPNMTKKEAQAMTRALSSEFNKAQKAAKKAAEESKKAAKATSAAYAASSKKAGASFAKLADEAKASANQIKNSFNDSANSQSSLREGSEQLGTSLGASNMALRELIPNLDKTARRAIDVADAVALAAEQSIKGGPITMALTAAVIAGAAAYQLMTKASRDALKATNKQLEGFKSLSVEIDKATRSAEQFAKSGRIDLERSITAERRTTFEINQDILLATGQITKRQFDLNKLRREENAAIQDTSSAQRAARETAKKSIEDLQKKRAGLKAEGDLLSNILRSTSADAVEKEKAKHRLTEQLKEYKKIDEAQSALRVSIQDSRALESQYTAQISASFDVKEKLVKAQHRINRAQEAQAALQERIKGNNDAILSFTEQAAAARQKSRDIMVSVLPMDEQISIRAKEQTDALDGQIKQLESRLLLMRATAKTDEEKLQLSVAEEQAVETITELKNLQSLTEQEALIEIDELETELDQKKKDRIAKTAQEKMDTIRDEANAIGELGNLTMGIFKNTVSTIGDLAKATGTENAHLVRSLFEMQRVAAIGEIAFNVAKGLTAATAYPPPLNGLMTAGAIAAGAAQTAAVLAQSPPEFHMGGMTPDETIAVVKSGEAVLDRATVNNLGGQQGVNRLQNGQTGGSPEVIVMNPYKHFDRFVTDRSRAGISSRSARRGY